MTPTNRFTNGRRLCSVLLVGTILGGLAASRSTRRRRRRCRCRPAPATPAPAAGGDGRSARSRSPATSGSSRRRSLSYIKLRVGEPYDRERLDEALRDLYGTELFADVADPRQPGQPRPSRCARTRSINRIVLEGNKRLKDDKITPEIQLAPRQIFTRSKARADVARIIELYRRQGRFAATVEPKIVQLEQNRVDVVFEINEGPKSKIRQINILGNEKFGDGELRGEMVTKRTGLLSFLGSGDSLRSRPAGLRPAEAAAVLPDQRLCRFPRRLGGRRADPGPARLHHHLRGRGRRALQVRRRQGRERDPRLQQRGARPGCCR